MRASDYWKLDLTACIAAVFLYAYMFVSVDSTTGSRNYYSVLRVTAMGIVSYGLAAAYFKVKGQKPTDSWKYISILGSIISSLFLLAITLSPSDGIGHLAFTFTLVLFAGSIQMLFFSGLAILVFRILVYLLKTYSREVNRSAY